MNSEPNKGQQAHYAQSISKDNFIAEKKSKISVVRLLVHNLNPKIFFEISTYTMYSECLIIISLAFLSFPVLQGLLCIFS